MGECPVCVCSWAGEITAMQCSRATSPPPQGRNHRQEENPTAGQALPVLPAAAQRFPPSPGATEQAQELVGTGKLCGLVLEHALTTCGSKAPGDKESKGLLSGDQAQLPLQKLWHSWVVGHSAGHWEQSLSPTWGSSRGAGAACNPHRCISDIRDQPELVAVHSLGQMKWAGQWSHAGTRATACSPSSAGRAGRHGMGWPGCGHCWSLQGQQTMGGQWLHRVGPGAQPLCRQAGQGPSLGAKVQVMKWSDEVPFVPCPVRA